MKLKLQTVENSYVQSLTINGDFQINQRGKSEYIENGNTLDMWNCILTNGNKLSQLPSGYGVLINKVKANQTILRQRNPNVSKYPVGTKFTAVYDFESNVSFSNEVGFGKQRKSIQVEAKRKQYVFTWTLQSNDIDENKNVDVLVFNNTDTNVQLKIYSVDVFEGETAYKHHREDYTLAFVRCSAFLKKGSFTASIYSHKSGSTNQYYVAGIGDFEVIMFSKPAIVALEVNIPNIGKLTRDKVLSIGVEKTEIGGTILMQLPQTIDLAKSYMYPVQIFYEVSCETQ